jgi:hypothetical protein
VRMTTLRERSRRSSASVDISSSRKTVTAGLR